MYIARVQVELDSRIPHRTPRVLGYGHKGRKTFGGETRIKTLIYADRSGGSGKDGGVIGHH